MSALDRLRAYVAFLILPRWIFEEIEELLDAEKR